MTTKEFPLLEIFFVNVGQGNCTIVKAYCAIDKFYCWIFDAGSNKYPLYIPEDTKKKFLPMAKRIVDVIGRGKAKPYRVFFMLSHPDSDHINLVPHVIKELRNSGYREVLNVYHRKEYLTKEFMKAMQTGEENEEEKEEKKTNETKQLFDEKNNTKFFPLEPGTILSWDGKLSQNASSKSKTLNYPIKTFAHKTFGKKRKNENSMVVLIEYTCQNEKGSENRRKILLPGDATAETWQRIKEGNGNEYPFEDIFLYQIPHHGAAECTFKGLLDIINPELCFISSHVNSQHDHPYFTTVDRVLTHLAQRSVSGQQKQPWHHIPFIRSQYLHELSLNVPNWHNVIPLGMCKTSDYKRQRTVYGTNLGLYSTTTGLTYCVTLSSKMETYKVDWFDQNQQMDTYVRDYQAQHDGKDLKSFSLNVFKNPEIYFPFINEIKKEPTITGTKKEQVTSHWTGLCIPNLDCFNAFFIKGNERYFKDLQYLDLRLCAGLSTQLVWKCLLHLENLVMILLPSVFRKRHGNTTTERLLLQQMMLDGSSSKARQESNEYYPQVKDFSDQLPEWILVNRLKKVLEQKQKDPSIQSVGANIDLDSKIEFDMELPKDPQFIFKVEQVPRNPS